MNRFFRTAYASTLTCLCLTLFGVLVSGVKMPFPAFSCLYFGLLLFLLPGASHKLAGKERLFYLIGTVTAFLGFVPLALRHCPPIHWVIHLLGIAAAALYLKILRHRTTHGIFLAKFEFTTVVLLAVIGLVWLGILTGIYQGGDAAARSRAMNLAVSCIVPYSIVMLASGVLLLRGLRAQPGTIDEQAFNRRQLRDTIIFAVLVTLIFAVDPFVYVKQVLYFLLNDVLKPGARYLVQLLNLLLRTVSVEKDPAGETLPTEEAADPEPVPTLAPGEAQGEHYFIEAKDLTLTIAYIFIAIAVLALLYLLAVQIRKLVRTLRERSRSRGSGYPNEIRESIPAKEETDREARPKRRSSDPRERIRWLYGDFLRHLHKVRVRFRRTDTCGEIERRAEDNAAAGPETLSGLTALYEEARYRLEDAPTEADVQAMKEFVDKVKKRA